MIPRDYVTEWREVAPWNDDFQVEQDLVISRSLTEIFSHRLLGRSLAFRGGTALYKLYLDPARYSEDIDLVQINAEPAGPVMDAMHEVLNPWLGDPSTKQNQGRVTFRYTFGSEGPPSIPLRLKIEINTREHFSLHGLKSMPFSLESRWHRCGCDIATFGLDELLGTKMRALYQRKKGRDLFDLALAIDSGKANPERVVDAFQAYMRHGGHKATRAQYEMNLAAKISDPAFGSDIPPLLARGREWDSAMAQKDAETVAKTLIQRLPGDPWKG